MRRKRREAILKIGAIAIVALFLLDRLVISTAIEHWKEQSQRIGALSEKVKRGRQIVERGKSLRARWNDMRRTDLHDSRPVAENDIFKAVGRWANESHITFTNLTQQWREHDDGYDSIEIRGAASGDQAALARLLYEIETDPLPARVNEFEVTSRDAQGKQLNLSLRFSFVRLVDNRRAR